MSAASTEPLAPDGEARLTRTRAAACEVLASGASFVLATHENPDGDALGSMIAMRGLLRALGKQVVLFISRSDLPLPHEYRFLRLEDVIETPPQDIAHRTVVFLDCGNIDRNPAAMLREAAVLLNIDHHHDNTRFGSVNHVVPTASCTAEIIWDLMNALEVRPTPRVAEALYVALVTDTGRFMYETTGPTAHYMAADLIQAGVDVQGLYRKLFEEVPLAKLKLLGLALNSVASYDEGQLTLASLSADDFVAVEAEEAHCEGIVDHLRSVRGTKVAALIREGPASQGTARRKVSLRATDDDVDVSAIARTQGGGGHRRAAGFPTELEREEIVTLLRRELARQLPDRAPAPVA